MGRFLFVVTGHTTYVGAHASIATELVERGHDVAWAGPERIHEPLPPGVAFYPVDDEGAARAREAWVREGSTGSFHDWLLDLRWLYDEYLIPFARGTLADVERAIADFRATVVVIDEHALAGALSARLRDQPWATLVRSAVLAHGVTGSQWPEIGTWLESKLDELQRDVGLEPIPRPNLSDRLVISFSTRELLGPQLDFPAQYRFVGPALDHRLPGTDDVGFPWDELREGNRVLVSLGTILSRRAVHFYEIVRKALGDSEAQVILVAPPEMIADPPANFIVRAFVPQLALLPHVDAVVSHGGYNTVLEALGHGLPLVVAPFTLDQPLVAEQVVRCGAGVRVRPARLRPAELRRAVATVLDEPSYREAARRLQASFAVSGGTGAATSALEELLSHEEEDGARGTLPGSPRPAAGA